MKKHILITALSNVLFGLIPIYWKLLGPISTSYILAHRILWSFLFTYLIIELSGERKQFISALKTKKAFLLTACAGIIITGNWYLYIWAVAQLRVLETSLAYYMSPIIVFILSVFVFDEKCGKWDIVAILLAALGIAISTVVMGIFPWISVALAVSFAAYGALKKAAGLNPAVSLTIEMMVVLPIALLYLAMTSFGEASQLQGLTVVGISLLIGTGIISSLPLFLYSYGIKELPFSLVAFLQFIWPTTSMLLSIFVFKETLNLPKIICFGFIMSGLLIFTVTKVKSQGSYRTKQE